MKNNIVIIARYKENLDWVNNLKDDILIYNKGDDFPYKFVKTDVPNVGRESETFVRSIVENYHILNHYEYITFLQGNPFEHCPMLFDLIDNQTETYIYLSKSATIHTMNVFHENFYMFNKNVLIFERLIDKKTTPYTYSVINNITKDIIEAPNEMEELLYVMDFMKLPYRNLHSRWSTGAQYKVSTKMILSKSQDWWKDFHKFIFYCYDTLNWIELGYTLERIWPVIWDYSYE